MDVNRVTLHTYCQLLILLFNIVEELKWENMESGEAIFLKEKYKESFFALFMSALVSRL